MSSLLLVPQDFLFLFWIGLCGIFVCVYVFCPIYLGVWSSFIYELFASVQLPVIRQEVLVFPLVLHWVAFAEQYRLVFSPTTLLDARQFNFFVAKSCCPFWVWVDIDFSEYFNSCDHKKLSTRLWGPKQCGPEQFLFGLCLQSSYSTAQCLPSGLSICLGQWGKLLRLILRSCWRHTIQEHGMPFHLFRCSFGAFRKIF